MVLPKYAQGLPKNRLVNILCRGKCGTGRWAKIQASKDNEQGTKVTAGSHAECLFCGYIASDPSNWQRAK